MRRFTFSAFGWLKMSGTVHKVREVERGFYRVNEIVIFPAAFVQPLANVSISARCHQLSHEILPCHPFSSPKLPSVGGSSKSGVFCPVLGDFCFSKLPRPATTSLPTPSNQNASSETFLGPWTAFVPPSPLHLER